jgi:DNA invertase Pin-like site-specific DNA recombinase
VKNIASGAVAAPGRLMLTVLGGLAEFERELIRARTGEGRSRAKARGVRFGRHQRQEAIQRLTEGATQADLQPAPFRGRKRRRVKRVPRPIAG